MSNQQYVFCIQVNDVLKDSFVCNFIRWLHRNSTLSTKGQLISICLLHGCHFLSKNTQNKSIWGMIVIKLNFLVRFWENWGYQKVLLNLSDLSHVEFRHKLSDKSEKKRVKVFTCNKKIAHVYIHSREYLGTQILCLYTLISILRNCDLQEICFGSILCKSNICCT